MKYNFKKSLILILSIFLGLHLFGCGEARTTKAVKNNLIAPEIKISPLSNYKDSANFTSNLGFLWPSDLTSSKVKGVSDLGKSIDSLEDRRVEIQTRIEPEIKKLQDKIDELGKERKEVLKKRNEARNLEKKVASQIDELGGENQRNKENKAISEKELEGELKKPEEEQDQVKIENLKKIISELNQKISNLEVEIEKLEEKRAEHKKEFNQLNQKSREIVLEQRRIKQKIDDDFKEEQEELAQIDADFNRDLKGLLDRVPFFVKLDRVSIGKSTNGLLRIEFSNWKVEKDELNIINKEHVGQPITFLTAADLEQETLKEIKRKGKVFVSKSNDIPPITAKGIRSVSEYISIIESLNKVVIFKLSKDPDFNVDQYITESAKKVSEGSEELTKLFIDSFGLYSSLYRKLINKDGIIEDLAYSPSGGLLNFTLYYTKDLRFNFRIESLSKGRNDLYVGDMNVQIKTQTGQTKTFSGILKLKRRL